MSDLSLRFRSVVHGHTSTADWYFPVMTNWTRFISGSYWLWGESQHSRINWAYCYVELHSALGLKLNWLLFSQNRATKGLTASKSMGASSFLCSACKFQTWVLLSMVCDACNSHSLWWRPVKLVKIGEGRKKHTVLLFICGTGFIQLWRECLLVNACDMLYIW